MIRDAVEAEWARLVDELDHFQGIARFLRPAPGEIPSLPGMEIHGVALPLNRIVGGDHLLYIDFNRRYDLDARIERAEAAGQRAIAEELRRNKRRAGILVADVAGHRITDALLVAMLHQAFLLGTYYELEMHGAITTRIFENINARFFESTTVNKYLTMLYGEISDEGRFRFISAAHPPPIVFSREFGRIMPISADRTTTVPPIGMFRSAQDPDEREKASALTYRGRYTVNEINLLGSGDILLLHTDGLTDHGGGSFFPAELERILAGGARATAEGLAQEIEQGLVRHGAQVDDISYVVLKKL